MKRSGFKMKGSPMQRNFGISPMKKESDRDELVKHTYAAGSVEARGAGYKSGESLDVFISKGTKRLIEAGAPKEVIEKAKRRDIELAKKGGMKTRNL